jgi:fucose 4-O-acetylase-like acetyltransferase
MENSNRLTYLDIAKGIGIILVVFGHTLIPPLCAESGLVNGIHTFIYYFHMPLFFTISGIIFEHNIEKYTNTRLFLNKKLLLLIVPYLVYSLISYIGINLCFRISSLASILGSAGYQHTGIKDMILGILFYQNHIDNHLWFIYLLFFTFVLNILTKKHKLVSLIVSVVFFIVVIAFDLRSGYDILSYSFILMFFSFGRYYVKIKPMKNIVFALLLSAFIAAAVFCIIKKISSWFNIIPLGFAGTMLVLETARKLENKKTIVKALSFLSDYSYDIYLIHQPFIVSGVCGILFKLNMPTSLIIIIGTVLGIGMPILISKLIIRKSKILSLLFLGREHKKG